jgi:hypothetical protein
MICPVIEPRCNSVFVLIVFIHSAAEDVLVSQPKDGEATSSGDIGRDLQVPEDHSLLETLQVEATRTEEELLADALLLQQHIGNDSPSVESESIGATKPVVS